MTRETDNIKCCPFCGSTASWWGTMDSEWIQCDTCGACTDVYNVDSGDARIKWNKRVDTT